MWSAPTFIFKAKSELKAWQLQERGRWRSFPPCDSTHRAKPRVSREEGGRGAQAKRGTCGVMQHCTVTHGHTQSSADTHSLNLMTNRWDLLPVSSTSSTSRSLHGEKWNRFSASDALLIRKLWSFLRWSAAWLLHTETHIFMKKIQGRFICVLQSELSPRHQRLFQRDERDTSQHKRHPNWQ